MVAGHAVSGGRARSSAASRMGRFTPIQVARGDVGAGSARGGLVTRRLLEGRGLRAALLVEDEVAAGILQQQLDLALRLLELGVAEAGQLDAFFVEDERLLERQLAFFQALHDLLELEESGLEGGCLGLFGQRGSFAVTRAVSPPSSRRTRTSAPTSTSAPARSRRPASSN